LDYLHNGKRVLAKVNMDDLFRVLSIIELMRDNYNHHASRVAEYTVKLAEAMGLPDIELISAGAHLHDVGKLLVSKDLLNLNRKLETDERKKIEEHALLGWAVVAEAKYDSIIQSMTRSHHEKWDGTGYPDQLTGQQIPIAARMLSVCDVYDALTNQRPYRDRYTYEFTKTYIQGLKGIAFDPEIVDLFFEKVIPTEEEGAVDA
jgi:putative nucleotidyltransferase with HDIG domain